MSNLKAVILCAGDGTRWNNYLGVPKQLIPINGEPLLNRTVRLLRNNGCDDIAVVSNDDRLNLDSCGFFKPAMSRWTVETLLSTQPLWKEQTLILLGDVFFTDQAIQTITEPDSEIKIYGRFGPSRFTFTHYGELFAISFDEASHDQMKEHLAIARLDAQSGGRGKLWEFYRSLAGFPLNKHEIESTIFTSIHDFTDDIDTPEEYEKMVRRFKYIASNSKIKRFLITTWLDWRTPFRPIKRFFEDAKDYTTQKLMDITPR